MRAILDTQVVSYAIKGSLEQPLPPDFAITLTVAQELVRVRNEATGDARYLTPPPLGISPDRRANYLAGQSIHGDDRPSNRTLVSDIFPT